jgi:pilus retraction protein PilT
MTINELLAKTLSEGASDLLLTAGRTPCLKKLGAVNRLKEPPTPASAIDAFRRQLSTPDEETIYKERLSLDKSASIPGAGRFRINFLQADGRPALVARPILSGNDLSLKDLMLPELLAEFATTPRGLILVSGSAGCGKSTSMAAIVNIINSSREAHIVTIEDPVEFVHEDDKSFISQREVGRDCPSFQSALRDVLREAPDVIVIGEMRDFETMQTAISAALTGHLVISSVHTPDSILTVERIVNQFPEQLRGQAAADLAMCLVGIISQRLIPSADHTRMIPANELLKATPRVRTLIAARDFKGLEDSMKRGREEGMKTFNRAISELFKANLISKDDGARASSNPDEFLLLASGMESGVETFRDDFDEEDELAKDRLDMRRLLHSAVVNGASDLILSAGERPCVRFDGDIVQLDAEPLSPSDTKRLLFSILTSRQRELFETERELDFALSLELKKHGKDVEQRRFRVNAFFQRGNVAVAIRVVPTVEPDPAALGIPSAVMDLATKRQGLLLVTGPTGHGKSTTLACLINRINATRRAHIITIEDPIEFVHANKMSVIEQREVHADTLSFANGLKYVLRQDPDVILVGEMRDTETMAAALTAAETGHLVLATLHTNDAPQSIDRIVDSFQAHQQNQIRLQLAASLLCVISQRLLPRKDSKGRVAAFEILMGSSGVRALVREGKTHMLQSAMETGMRDGMVTMEKALKELHASGMIGREDVASLLRADQLV